MESFLSPSSSSSSFTSDDDEAGISTSFTSFYSSGRRASYTAMGGVAVASPSPRSGTVAKVGFFCDAFADDEPRHFLDSCFLCNKPLAGNRDIFMYRGDKPFCSEECRQEQIEMDEAIENERSRRGGSSTYPFNTASTGSDQKNQSSQRIQLRAGTVVVG